VAQENISWDHPLSVKTGSAGVARRWGRSHCAEGAGPAAGDGVSGTAARHQAARFYWNEMQATHNRGNTPRGGCGHWLAKEIKQCCPANRVDTVQSIF
jgi:hypothetical protein